MSSTGRVVDTLILQDARHFGGVFVQIPLFCEFYKIVLNASAVSFDKFRVDSHLCKLRDTPTAPAYEYRCTVL